jgi:mono/diheme cytochrome c family protein
MKNTWIIGILSIALLAGCNKVRRSPGRAYMPDMVYSRAYESYANAPKNIKDNGFNYNSMPVAGTIARGDMLFIYPNKNDSAGYAASASVKNPYNPDSIDIMEAKRLYLVNCGICHGDKLDGNGPLFNGGNGPYTAAPKNFMADDMKKMAEGTMFHSATYGKGAMGSYASQLSTSQRWMVVTYIKWKQNATMASDTTKTTTQTKDTTHTK